MLELLPGAGSMILEDADILEASVALEILNALCGQEQELFEFAVACVPQMPLMRRIFHQNFVRANGAHTVVDAIAAAGSLAFDMVQSAGMHRGTRRPRSAGKSRHGSDNLRRFAGIGAEPANRFRTRHILGDVVSRNNPGTGNRILA